MSKYSPEKQAEINAKRTATRKRNDAIRSLRSHETAQKLKKFEMAEKTQKLHPGMESPVENTARPERMSIGVRQQKLEMISNNYPVSDEWHKCWVEDDDKGNFERFKRSWYEPITTPAGELITFPSGPYRMVLMKVLTKYYDEDQKLLAAENSSRIVKQIAIGKDEYAPDKNNPAGGRQALTRDVVDPMRHP